MVWKKKGQDCFLFAKEQQKDKLILKCIDSEKTTIRYENCIESSKTHNKRLRGEKSLLLFPSLNPFVNYYFFQEK